MYRQHYAGLPDDFSPSFEEMARLPIVTKEDIKDNFPDRTIADGIAAETLYEVATSGTTDRVMLFHDEEKRDWDRAADLFKRTAEGFAGVVIVPPNDCYERCGLGEDGPIKVTPSDLVSGNRATRREAWRDLMRLAAARLVWKETPLTAPGVDGTAVGDDILAGYLSEMQAPSVSIMKALPMYGFVLAQRTDEADRGLKFFRPVGGKATPYMREVIEKNLHCRYWEHYGSAELGTVAEGCEHHLLHPMSRLFHIEFVRGGQPVPPGEPGEMLITDLQSKACPLIRYSTGDIGRRVSPGCCGNDDTIEVYGRLQETVVTRDGRVIRPDLLLDLFLAHGSVDFAKLVQRDDDRFVLQFVGDCEDRKILEQELATRLKNFLDEDVQLQLQQVRRIAPEGSGKYRLVESTSWHRFHNHVDAA